MSALTRGVAVLVKRCHSLSLDGDRIEAGRVLFAQNCGFVTGAGQLGQLPLHALPELAFVGRSNVGKSSLINSLTGRKSLARTSNTPGRTQQINFFNLGDRLMLVDLPGYGYARAPKISVIKWTQLIHLYLKGRANLRRVCVLVDARHGLKDSDRSLMRELDQAAVAYQIVLTKVDKVKNIAQQARCRIERELLRHPAAFPAAFLTSAQKDIGLSELRAELMSIVPKLGQGIPLG